LKYERDDNRVIVSGEFFEDVEAYGCPPVVDKYVHVLKVPLRDGLGKIVGIQGVFWDVTSRKKVVDELSRTAETLRTSNEDLEKFAYLASHDLQEPLRTVGGFCELLTRSYREKLDSRGKDYLGFIGDAVTRMQGLVKSLLDFSRIGVNRPLQPICLSAVVGAAAFNLHATIEENAAVIEYDELPTVLANKSELIRLFQNLISNAIKFRSAERPVISIQCVEMGCFWRFEVRDNGIGIADSERVRIFELFHRLQTRRDSTGTGIGLASCQKIVRALGGDIWVESQEGKGSCFFFTIPQRK
jgi:light-regulated signal transduction histidine kinase (bacteriophytochrome)